MNKNESKINDDKIHQLKIKEKEAELRWAQEFGVDLGRNFTVGLPRSANKIQMSNSTEEYTLFNDDETESSDFTATTASTSAVVITGLVLGASCFMMNKNRSDESKIDHQTSLIGEN